VSDEALNCDFRRTVAIAMPKNFAPVIVCDVSGVNVSSKHLGWDTGKHLVVVVFLRIEGHICGHV